MGTQRLNGLPHTSGVASSIPASAMRDVEFACSLPVSGGFLQVHWFPTPVQMRAM